MKRIWVWLVGGAVVFLGIAFVLSLYLVSRLVGDDSTFAVGEGIGLVEVKGVILDPQETVKQLHDFARNEQVKAVVLRIDSPGGVVGPAQEIHREVQRLAARKKVVVSMGSIAASGGYYIAVPASVIYANPGTITGSVGVLMKFSNVQGLMEKIGLQAFTLTTGKFKDSGSPLRPMTPQERAVLQGVIESSHGQFVKAVAEGRKLPIERVRQLADGRIYTGEQALGLKLIDKLGTLQDAVEEAGRLAGIEGEPELIKPPKKHKRFVDLLVEESAERISNFTRAEQGYTLSYEVDWGGR